MRLFLACLACLPLLVSGAAGQPSDEQNRAPLTVASAPLELRLTGPASQWARLIALFRESPYPDGAAALAAWKGATKVPGERSLGKAAEALIASLNPGMAREMSLLEGARLLAWPRDDRWTWLIFLPSDDGTLRDLLSAQVLTEGGPEPPAPGLAARLSVDRLGPPGSALVARDGPRLFIGSNREALDLGLALSPPPTNSSSPSTSEGLLLLLDPASLIAHPQLPWRQIARGLTGLGGQALNGSARVTDDGLTASLQLRLDRAPRRSGRIDPTWLSWIDPEPMAALCLALDPSREAWDEAFRAADLVEKADPARKDVAPLRLRLSLLASAAGLRLDRDLYPKVRGLTLSLLEGNDLATARGRLVIHTTTPDDAIALATTTLPKIFDRWLGQGHPEASARIWRWGPEQRLALAVDGPDVLLSVGHPSQRPLRPTSDRPGQPVPAWLNPPPDADRLGLLRPGLLARLADQPAPLVSELDRAPLIVWWGTTGENGYLDQFQWLGLPSALKRFLTRHLDGADGA